jgi:hypothetical protein
MRLVVVIRFCYSRGGRDSSVHHQLIMTIPGAVGNGPAPYPRRPAKNAFSTPADSDSHTPPSTSGR